MLEKIKEEIEKISGCENWSIEDMDYSLREKFIDRMSKGEFVCSHVGGRNIGRYCNEYIRLGFFYDDDEDRLYKGNHRNYKVKETGDSSFGKYVLYSYVVDSGD